MKTTPYCRMQYGRRSRGCEGSERPDALLAVMKNLVSPDIFAAAIGLKA